MKKDFFVLGFEILKFIGLFGFVIALAFMLLK
jgi:hypothetical protein